MYALTFALVFTAAAGTSLFQTSPRQLGKEFDQAQKLMSLGDFEGSIAQYRRLRVTPGNWLLRPDQVAVQVGEEELPLQVAAAYQVASSFRRRGEEWLEAKTDTAQTLGREDLRQAAGYYQELGQDPLAPLILRQRAAYQAGICRFKAGEYAQAAAALDSFQQEFPHSEYLGEARYYVAWSHFHLEEWDNAVEGFVRVARADSSADRAERAWFQAGECYERLGRWDQARDAFAQLAGRYDPRPYQGKRRLEDIMQALRLNLTGTQRELIGKAHLRLGDAYRHLDSLDTAASWYQRTAERFPTEPELVQAAYLRLVDLQIQQGNTDGALAILRQALEELTDPLLRAQVQAEYMGLAYKTQRFLDAAQAHRLYIDTFADQAAAVGVSVDQAQLLLAESLRQETERRDQGTARDSLGQEALGAYRVLLERGPPDTLAAEAMLGVGLCLHDLDSLTQAQAQLEQVGKIYPDTRAGTWARLQQARGYAEQQDTLQASSLYEGLQDAVAQEVRDQARVELALIWARRGRQTAALDLLSAIGPASTEYGRARAALAQAYSAQGNPEHAGKAVEEALRADLAPNTRSELGLSWATLAFQQENFQTALQRLAAVDTTRLPSASRAEWLYLHGTSQYQVGEYASAFQDLQACRRQATDLALRQQTLDLLGFCMAEMVDEPQGAALFAGWIDAAGSDQQRAELQLGLARFWYRVKAYQKSVDFLSRLRLQDPPLDREARFLRGEGLLAVGEWEAGKKVLQEIEPSGLPEAELRRREYLFGLASMNLGEYDQAIAHLDSLLALRPEPAMAREARLNVGRSWYTLGQHDQAVKVLTDLVEAWPGTPEAREAAFLAGENLYLMGEYARAAEAYGRVQQGERQPAATLALAWCRLELKQEQGFLSQLEEIRKRFPDTEQAREAAMLVGDYYYNKQDYPAARRAYQQLLDRYPGSQEATQAGTLLVELADLEADLVYRAAMATFDLGQYDQAAPLLQAVIQRYPHTPSEMAARCNLGATYERLGKTREAVGVYDSVLVAAADNPAYADMAGFAREHRTALKEE
jgi:TolA-binding protein